MEQVDHELLGAYFDGELAEADARRVEQRIAASPDWAAAYAQLQSLDGVLDAYAAPAAPADLAGRIIAASQAPQRSLTVRIMRLAVPAAAAAAVLLMVALVGPWRSNPGDRNELANGNALSSQGLVAADVDALAKEQLHFFSNLESIQTLADNESLLNSATMDALAQLEGPREGQ